MLFNDKRESVMSILAKNTIIPSRGVEYEGQPSYKLYIPFKSYQLRKAHVSCF